MAEHINFSSLYVNYQSYSYTPMSAESIRRASPGCMWSTPTSQTLRQQVTMAFVTASILLNVHIMQSNALHMTLNPIIIYICSVNILCV